MTVKPFDRNAANRFALALDEGGRLKGRRRPDRVADEDRTDTVDADLGLLSLLRVADSLTPLALSQPGPTDEFRDELRQHLLELASAPNPMAPTRVLEVAPARLRTGPAGRARSGHRRRLALGGMTQWRRRLVAAGAGATLATGVMSGITVASTGALPGDGLYGVKRTVEDIGLSLSLSDETRGQRHLGLADKRLGEIETMLNNHGRRPEQPTVVHRLDDTLGEMASSTRRGSSMLTDAYNRTRKPKPLTTLQDFTRGQRQRLQALQGQLPGELDTEPAALLEMLDQIDSLVAQLTNSPQSGGGGHDNQQAPPTAIPSAPPTPTPSGGTTPAPNGQSSEPPAGGASGGPPLPGLEGTPTPGTTPAPAPSVGVTLPPLLPDSSRDLPLSPQSGSKPDPQPTPAAASAAAPAGSSSYAASPGEAVTAANASVTASTWPSAPGTAVPTVTAMPLAQEGGDPAALLPIPPLPGLPGVGDAGKSTVIGLL